MVSSAKSTTSGLATPPLPSAKPLVYITGSSSTSTKQTVAEYSALLLGDEAILIDQPYTLTMTPPPPSSTPPNDGNDSSSVSRHKRPKGLRLSSSAASTSTTATFSSAKSTTHIPTSSSRSCSTSTTAAMLPPSLTTPYFDPLLTTLASNPHRTAILTDTKRRLSSSSSSSPSSSSSSSSSYSTPPAAISPPTAAAKTGRPFLLIRLGAPAATSPSYTDPQPTPAIIAATLALSDHDTGTTSSDPHAAALRVVEFVREFNARRRSHGDWEGVNEGLLGDGDEEEEMGGQGRRRTRADSCVCGVITPVLTPAEEKREMRF